MKYVYPVLVGLITTVAAGIVLAIAGYIIFGVMSLLPVLDDILALETVIRIFLISIGLWLFLSAGTGGYASVHYIKKKEDFAIFLLAVVSIIAAWYFETYNLPFLFKIIPFVAGYISGGWLGMRHKKKKAKEPKMTVQDY